MTSHGDSTAIVTVGDSIAVGQNLHTVVVVCPQDPDGDCLPATDEGETDQVVFNDITYRVLRYVL